jgi:hypothetical protein
MQDLVPASPERAGDPVKLNDAMVGAGATILRGRFHELGPYSAKHLAAEVFAAMQAMSTASPAERADV